MMDNIFSSPVLYGIIRRTERADKVGFDPVIHRVHVHFYVGNPEGHREPLHITTRQRFWSSDIRSFDRRNLRSPESFFFFSARTFIFTMFHDTATLTVAFSIGYGTENRRFTKDHPVCHGGGAENTTQCKPTVFSGKDRKQSSSHDATDTGPHPLLVAHGLCILFDHSATSFSFGHCRPHLRGKCGELFL